MTGRAAAEPIVHDLKTWSVYYPDVAKGRKTFEIRKDDRGFRVGHFLRLREWDPSNMGYTGSSVVRKIVYRLDAHDGLHPGYVILGIEPAVLP
jgi:hypothetical protein